MATTRATRGAPAKLLHDDDDVDDDKDDEREAEAEERRRDGGRGSLPYVKGGSIGIVGGDEDTSDDGVDPPFCCLGVECVPSEEATPTLASILALGGSRSIS
mmetsp:Transcript_26624/g.73245  ORF Transcript_26624/g.73245 Transcript_26624/m.73245 type:complete len:102 (-) Transcript_26624:716-1021(-)